MNIKECERKTEKNIRDRMKILTNREERVTTEEQKEKAYPRWTFLNELSRPICSPDD